jgi:hypothetical protein
VIGLVVVIPYSVVDSVVSHFAIVVSVDIIDNDIVPPFQSVTWVGVVGVGLILVVVVVDLVLLLLLVFPFQNDDSDTDSAPTSEFVISIERNNEPREYKSISIFLSP